MTDAVASSGFAGSDPARLKRRHRAEVRLRAYGIAALVFAGLSLIALMGSVVLSASEALRETYVTLPVELSAEVIDPDGTGDPNIIRRADFNGLTRDALRTRFPNATGRTERRALNELLSVGASFELADQAAANPSMIGQTMPVRMLASDTLDLYLKGAFGGLDSRQVDGTLSVTVDDDTAVLTSDADDFASLLAQARSSLRAQSDELRHQASLQNNGVEEFARRAEAAENEGAKTRALKQVEARTAKRDGLLAEADALLARADSTEGFEPLGENNASALIRAGGGWFKLTEVARDRVSADILVAPTGAISDWSLLINETPEANRKLTDTQIVWAEDLRDAGELETVFNTRFFTASDSREPELAGIWGAAVGSFWTMLVTFALAFPIGVLSAIYLEEFAPKNRLTALIEVNINNLAAVPSIIFGLLGLAVIIGFFGVPRSAPLAGGIVLALMTLPTIIIASRVSIAAVPPSIREAALGVGASRLQVAFHHVLPLSMPGILTGAIIGMARALGETAPLIMIGMVAFIVDVPDGVTDNATVLPVQVFRWADFPERAFESRTALAICVLLVFLIVMNALAVFLRKRFERRW